MFNVVLKFFVGKLLECILVVILCLIFKIEEVGFVSLFFIVLCNKFICESNLCIFFVFVLEVVW